MNNSQLYLSIGIPSILIVLAWISNRSDVIALRAEMVQLRKDMAAYMTQLRKDIHNDMTQLRDSIHRDMISLHERVAIVETRQLPS